MPQTKAIFISLAFYLWLAASPKASAAVEQNSNIHFQSTTVTQQHESFHSPYQGENSLISGHDVKSSITWTVFAGRRLWTGAEVYLNPELTGGDGFNHTVGIAGFPNGEIYRVDDGSPKWSLARLYLRQTFGFGEEDEAIKDDKNQLSGSEKIRRLTIVAGRFAPTDFFDNNTYSHDPRTQFLNWAIMDLGAWDYAADTHGYTWGIYLELNQPKWSLRWSSVMVPREVNQIELDKDFPARRGDNLEFEYRYTMNSQAGVARMIAFENTANMGGYRQTINHPEYNMDIARTRKPSLKYGLGLNFEQAVTDHLGAFLRLSWNDGHTETWNFTEIDRCLSAGLVLNGTSWNRRDDSVGLAFALNGLALDHRTFLADGGYGLMIGDSRLRYAPETIGELYYLYRVIPNLDLTGDYQFIENPGYNSDRGPVSVFSLRLHYEI